MIDPAAYADPVDARRPVTATRRARSTCGATPGLYDDELALTAVRAVGRCPASRSTSELDEDSVGEIIAAEFDDEPIAADGMSVWTYTDADGHVYVELYSRTSPVGPTSPSWPTTWATRTRVSSSSTTDDLPSS